MNINIIFEYVPCSISIRNTLYLINTIFKCKIVMFKIFDKHKYIIVYANLIELISKSITFNVIFQFY